MENKTEKYFKYAIGEIVLVVIGILIALQINNWNEQQKLKEKEIEVLTNLKVDLEKTLVEIHASIEFSKVTITEIDKLEYYSKQELKYNDELDYSFGVFQHFYPIYITKGTYNTIQNLGLDIISNKQLRKDIPKIFEFYFVDILDYMNDENALKNVSIQPFFQQHLQYTSKSSYSAKPNNYNGLMLNNEFFNLLSMVKRQRSRGIEKLLTNKTPIEKLIKDISVEINKK